MIFIALGANLPSLYGSPEETLEAALQVLGARGIEVVRASSIWLSAPVPVSDQLWYRNAVICVRSHFSEIDLLNVLKEIEHDFGRLDKERNAPRVLDLDIISYHDEVCSFANLTVPHPRMHERAFVLYPLREIAPEWVHPETGLHIDQLIKNLSDDQEIERVGKFFERGAA